MYAARRLFAYVREKCRVVGFYLPTTPAIVNRNRFANCPDSFLLLFAAQVSAFVLGWFAPVVWHGGLGLRIALGVVLGSSAPGSGKPARGIYRFGAWERYTDGLDSP